MSALAAVMVALALGLAAVLRAEPLPGEAPAWEAARHARRRAEWLAGRAGS